MRMIFLFSIAVLICIVSCTAVQVKERPIIEYTQPLRGNVKSILIVGYTYPTEGSNSSVVQKDSSTVFYDKRNRKINQREKAGKFDGGITYTYDKNRLTGILLKTDLYTQKTLFTYDKRENVASREQYRNEVLISKRDIQYDRKNNPTEITNFNSLTKSTIKEYRDYDYKAGIVYIKEIINDKFNSSTFAVEYFNKRGLITKSGILKGEKGIFNHGSAFKYDAEGSLTERSLVAGNGKAYHITKYTKIEDRQGNIVKRLIFLDNKLMQETHYFINYR